MVQILRRATVLALILAPALPAQETKGAIARKKLLFLTHSAGYVHDVVKRPAPDQLSFAEVELTAIAKERGIRVDCTQDCSVLNAENLKRYDVVAFYTTGELPAPPGGAQALIDWVRGGGGFVGIHCAADTWYTVPAYGDMVGGVFESHPWNQEVRVNSADTWRDALVVADEIYQFKNFSPEPLTTLLTLDLRSVDASKGTRADGDYELAWTRDYGNGRVFYTALGHRESVWKEQRFRRHLLFGLTYAATYKGINSTLTPEGAKVLCEVGHVAPAFTHRDVSTIRWKFEQGRITVVPKSGDIISMESFGDCRLHVEFRVPAHPPEDQGQARGNSGVYLQDRYEIQVLDSFGLASKSDDCGAIYGKHAPLTNACRKAGEWQSYDVGFKAARFDAAKKKIANARASVWQNGLRIHDDVEIDGPTGGGEPESPAPGPIRLQDHGNLVSYRNIWVVPR